MSYNSTKLGRSYDSSHRGRREKRCSYNNNEFTTPKKKKSKKEAKEIFSSTSLCGNSERSSKRSRTRRARQLKVDKTVKEKARSERGAVCKDIDDKDIYSYFSETIGDEYGSHDTNKYEAQQLQVQPAQINAMLPKKQEEHLFFRNAGIAWKRDEDVQFVIKREKEKMKEKIPKQLEYAKSKLEDFSKRLKEC